MRGAAIVFAILLAAPLGAALSITTPRVAQPALLGDISDGDLLMLLAPLGGHDVTRLAPITQPDADVATLAYRISQRMGAEAVPEDFAMFRDLHADVAVPVATLLTAIDAAWTMRDEAFAGVSREAMLAVLAMAPEEAAATNKAAPTDPEALIAAAILLLDTAEAVVIPQLQAAADSPAWPATALADPVGVLRIGGTGNDYETVDRVLQVDPRGDDVYRNNAGGATLGGDLDPYTSDYAIAMHIDLAGNDDYRVFRRYTLGSALAGIGITLDLAGDDYAECGRDCMGRTDRGVAVYRDFEGSDEQACYTLCQGHASLLGIMRDDAGTDDRTGTSAVFGSGAGENAIALLWDRSGADRYLESVDSRGVLGGSYHSGHGLFVDETLSLDEYPAHQYACEGCSWRQGYAPGLTGELNGFGEDNSRGLGALLARVVASHTG